MSLYDIVMPRIRKARRHVFPCTVITCFRYCQGQEGRTAGLPRRSPPGRGRLPAAASSNPTAAGLHAVPAPQQSTEHFSYRQVLIFDTHPKAIQPAVRENHHKSTFSCTCIGRSLTLLLIPPKYHRTIRMKLGEYKFF